MSARRERNHGDIPQDQPVTTNGIIQNEAAPPTLAIEREPVSSSTLANSNAQLDGMSAEAFADRFLTLVPHEFARRHLMLPAGLDAALDASGTPKPKGAAPAPPAPAAPAAPAEPGSRPHTDAEHALAPTLLISERTAPAPLFNVHVLLETEFNARTVSGELLAAAIDRAYSDKAARARHADHRPGVLAARDELPIIELDLPAPGPAPAPGDINADLAAVLRDAERDLINTQGKSKTVRLVDLLLFEALQRAASDIHIQPLSDRVVVRYRVDGVLRSVRELPASLAASVISRVKVMSRLDVAEQNAPQDGRATVTMGGSSRRVDLRISTLPTTYGERIVIRLLDTASTPHLLTFTALGMPAGVERPFLAQLSRPSGIVLVTGPTGSGKTTTLYTALAWISTTNAGTVARPPRTAQPRTGSEHHDASHAASDQPSRHAPACELNIMTIEDPVEYDLSTSGLTVSQTQLNTKKNVTFAAGLRHILRQDPDVIMVGEIRDEETARIAVQASLTGHLVLSTLHTNDAASAVARLLDLGVEPFLVSSSLSAVLAQRLVRLMHAACQGAGCVECLGTGFKGRRGVFELLVLDADLRRLVNTRADAAEIKRTAIARSTAENSVRTPLVPLREAGLAFVRAGLTTEAELSRVIEAVDEQ